MCSECNATCLAAHAPMDSIKVATWEGGIPAATWLNLWHIEDIQKLYTGYYPPAI